MPDLDPEALRRAHDLAVRSLSNRQTYIQDPDAGFEALDVWSDGDLGCVLVVASSGYRGWWEVNAERGADGEWQVISSGGDLLLNTTAAADELPTVPMPGIRSIGGGSSDEYRTTIGIASVEVRTLRLRDDVNTRDIPMGSARLFMLVSRLSDPVTYAVGLDHRGNDLPYGPLLL